MKRRYTAGERAAPVPGHGGMYRMSDEPGWSWIGQGPRPHYQPTRAALVAAKIDPAAFAAALVQAGGPDLFATLGADRVSAPAPVSADRVSARDSQTSLF